MGVEDDLAVLNRAANRHIALQHPARTCPTCGGVPHDCWHCHDAPPHGHTCPVCNRQAVDA
jgi:hypothetical protein